MKAMSFTRTGGPEVLLFNDIPDPIPNADEVVIRMQIAGVNFADIYRRRGEYSSEPPPPFVLGHEGAGIIQSVGNSVREFAVGDRVAFAHVPRSNAEFVRAPAWKVVALPKDISFENAAGLLMQGLTAHYLTHDSYSIKASDTVLVHSASGGVGALLTQICKIKGAKVIGTVSTLHKIESARRAGADHVIVRTKGSWKNEILKATQGLGVNVGYDAIGSTLNETLDVVSNGGTAVYFGWAGGPPPVIDANVLMDGSKTLVGGELWSHIADREALLRRTQEIFSWIREKKILPPVFQTFPLQEAAAAHQKLESGKTVGKLLLKIN